jgi:hypothetical protein
MPRQLYFPIKLSLINDLQCKLRLIADDFNRLIMISPSFEQDTPRPNGIHVAPAIRKMPIISKKFT